MVMPNWAPDLERQRAMRVLDLPGAAIAAARVGVDGAALERGQGEFGSHEEGGACGQGDEADQAEDGQCDVHVSTTRPWEGSCWGRRVCHPAR